MRHCLTLWCVLVVAALLTGCGGNVPTHADTPAPAVASPVSAESAPPTAIREIPQGPPIGSFAQPKDIVVMVDRDETIANGVTKAADIIADDTSSWFTRYGPTNCGSYGVCWKEASIGYSGHMWWTWNNKYTTSNYGTWSPYFQCPGIFGVSAYIPNNNATTAKAQYTINHANGSNAANINQNNYYNQWVGIGSYTFNQSGSSVKLIDVTGETAGTKRIGFDAMKWSWQSASPNTWLTVSYPNGGETLYKSDCIPVYWNSSGLSDNVRIHLYRYGSIYKGLTNNTSNDGYECISASNFSDVSNGGGYTIGMSNVNSYCDGTTYDFSNSAFTITSPSITVNSPNGGENYMGTGTMGITWSSAGVSGNVRIELCQYGSCNVTIHSGASNTGSYTWNILNTSGSGYQIRLTSVNDTSIWDQSNGTFTITPPPPPVATITTNGGNNFSTAQASVQLTGSCTDGNNDLDWIRYNNSATGWNTTDYSPSGGSFNFSQGISLTSGSNTIQVTCQDLTGAWSTDTITITYTPVGTISGTVTNTGGSTLPGATVQYGGPQSGSVATNGSGQYALAGLTPGTYSLMAKMGGYYDSPVQNVSVSAGNTSGANFTLTKIPLPSLYYSPNSISVSGMNSGSINSTQSFVIKNTGDATLTYTLSPNVSWASIQRNGATVSGVQQSLAPGIQAAFTVVFNSNGIASTQSGVVAITSNDATPQGTPTISLNMGITPPPPQPPAPAEQPAPLTPPLQPAQYGPCQTQNRCYADPVNTAIGNYLYESTDMAIEARGPVLVFARYYNSLDSTVGPLGLGWTHSLNIYLLLSSNGDVYVRWGSGQTDWHVYNSSTGGFTPPAGVYDQLTKSSQYILTDKDQNVWIFSAAGQLQSITDRLNNKLTLAYDSQGRLTTAANAVGDTLTFAYLSGTDSKLASVTDFTSRKVQFAYSGNLLTQVTDVLGKTFGFAYDAGNRLEKITERDGKTLVSNTYDSSGRVIDQYDGLNNHTKFEYNTPSAGQTAVTDPANNKHIYSYDALYRLTSQKAPTGDTVSFLYNTQNLPVETTDTNGKKSLSAYDSRGNLTSFTDASGAKWLWTYDTLDRVTSHTTPLGQSTNYSYDTNGNLSQASTTISGTTHSVTYGYLSTGELSSLTDPMGVATTYAYNSKGELTGVTNGNSETTNFAYDVLHRQTNVTDPLTRKWIYAYNAADDLTSETSPLSKASTYNYDARGQLITESHPDGSITHNYDDAGRLASLTTPAGTTTIGYNAINQRTSETDPAGQKTTLSYNALGYLTGITDPTGKSASFSYDAMGRLLSSTNSAGQKTTFTLDDDTGRPTTITNPLNATVNMTYNAAGEVTETKDPAQNSFKTTYDNAGRKTQAVNPLQGAIKQQYDKNSRITQLTTPAGTNVLWTYDNVGRILSQTSPSGTKRNFVYDAAGQLTSITNAGNQKTSMDYDADGKLTKTTFADGVMRSFTYDAGDRPTQITAANKTRSYTYDTANRITSSTDSWNKTLSYTYTAAGALASITYPGNKVVSYGYDAAGRMASVTDWLGGTTSYTYDSAGRLQQTSFPNGVKTTRSYDGASRVTGITHKKSDGTILYSQAIAYDSRGNITSIDVTPEPTAWTKSAETNYTTNTEDQYTQAGSELLGYDPVGQMLTRNLDGATASYTFDARERLSSITSGGATTSFTYGPEGERIEKVTSTQTTRYMVDTNSGLPRVLAELDATSTPATYYIHGIGLVARTPATGTAIQYYHEDVQSNIAALTDSSAAITDTYVYHPFGKVLAKTGTTANPYQFAGHLGVETDGTLLYMRARYYDPTLGRFISKDPLGIAAGDINLYSYASNNPTGYNDPSGLLFDVLFDLAFIAYDVYSLVTEPSWENAAALGLDIVGAAIPVATGLGAAYKVTKSAGKAVDTYVTTQKLTHIANTADKAIPFTKNAAITGTLKHSAAEKMVQKSMPDLATEVSYTATGKVTKSRSNSVTRLDVVQGDIANPSVVYDFKFGKKGVTSAQTNKIQSTLNNPSLPVIEIRPKRLVPYSTTATIVGSTIVKEIGNALLPNSSPPTQQDTPTSTSNYFAPQPGGTSK